MPLKKSKPTSPWEKLDKIIAATRCPQGTEWFSVQDYSTKYKIPRSTADDQLYSMVSNGTLEMWKGRVTGVGRKTLFRITP